MDHRHLVNGKVEVEETEFRTAVVIRTDRFLSIQRHGATEGTHTPPHRINSQANLRALPERGADSATGISTTGSLHTRLKPETLAIPHDCITISGTPTTGADRALHIISTLSDVIRQGPISAALQCDADVMR